MKPALYALERVEGARRSSERPTVYLQSGWPFARKSLGLRDNVMERSGQFTETIANYRRHGWTLRRVLLRAGTRAEIGDDAAAIFEDAPVAEAEIDALWFARPSHAGREAWELRLVADTPYALFETFEPDEAEEEREELRREMEARLRDYANQA